MSKRIIPKFKVYSKFGNQLTDNPKLSASKLTSKKWQLVFSARRRPRKETEFGSLLRAKQRLNAFYGSIKNRQLTTLFVKAGKYNGNQTINFIKLLERRLDIFLFRAKISPSLHEIRQLIQHGHFYVNDHIVKTASLSLNKGDKIHVKATSMDLIKSKVNSYCSQNSVNITKKMKPYQVIRNFPILFTPNYIEFNYILMEGYLVDLPDVENVLYPMNPDLTALMEYYKYKKRV
jgi:small subunit ribosomal protein S4